MRSVLASIALIGAIWAPATAAGPSAVAAPQARANAAQVRLTEKQLLPKTEAIYATKPMLDTLLGEDTRIIDHGVLIHYMSGAERERSRIVIVNGSLYTSTGEPTRFGTEGETLNYAMDAAGNFYVFDQVGHPELRHSSFLAGRPVACAGDLRVTGARIVRIDRASGHYNPSPEMFRNVLIELRSRGVDVSGLGR
jgi:hypothetical protein